MEFQGASGTPWVPKLSLENYLHLEKLDVISSSILRKIIMMHGFKSVKVPKNDLMGAVRSINLMDAHHSTLQCDVSSNAFLSLNDVIRDLSVLHWQECCITAVETINCVTDFSSVVDEASSKCSKSECNTASSSRNDSVDHKTQSQVLMKFTVKGIRSARRPKQNFNTASSWTGNLDRYTTQLQALDKIKGHTSAKHVKRNFNTVFSSKDDSEGHQAQSHALNTITGNRSAEHYKPNFDTIYTPVFSSKVDSEGHKRQSQTLNEMVVTGNISANYVKSNFNMVFSSQEDSEGHRTQFQLLKKIDGNTSSARFGEQVDHINRPRRGIKKPTWMNEYVSPKSKASYQI
ncbi:hypothetical protein CTI12_AA079620 [Artemisia annua]|uniref:DUF7787 domain-containing protein n=1 Tax=Artemisia annua TaxID=35608 RepID=A0A2U1NU99_ARTAN|nr:hypothetical protein CTI12_AA079620 [Artemisia annua]